MVTYAAKRNLSDLKFVTICGDETDLGGVINGSKCDII